MRLRVEVGHCLWQQTAADHGRVFRRLSTPSHLPLSRLPAPGTLRTAPPPSSTPACTTTTAAAPAAASAFPPPTAEPSACWTAPPPHGSSSTFRQARPLLPLLTITYAVCMISAGNQTRTRFVPLYGYILLPCFRKDHPRDATCYQNSNKQHFLWLLDPQARRRMCWALRTCPPSPPVSRSIFPAYWGRSSSPGTNYIP